MKKLTEKEIIAWVIGNHFWYPENDKQAIQVGMECAEKVCMAMQIGVEIEE
jgi:hypothetical protein